MRIRILSIAVALLMVVSLFSACGFAEEELSVTLMAYAGSNKDSTDEAFYQKMSEASGVKVNFIAAPSDYRDNVTKQTTLLSSGDTTVDIFHCDEPMLSTFMNAGFLEPITDAVSANIGAFPQDYVKSMCSKDGEIYAVPTEVQPVMLFVNRELFEKAGIAYPKTEQEFIDAAKALTSGDVYGYGAAWTKGFMYNCLERWMYDFDGDFFNWQNENSKKAVQFMYDCINTYKITPLAALGDDYDAMNQKMADGKYAMIFQWQYAAGIFKDAGVYGNGGPIEIIDMPTFANNKSLTGGWNYVLTKSSKNKEAAKKLLQYLSSPEGQAAFGIQSSQIPANSAALDNETLRENIAGLDMAMFYIQNVPLLPRPTHAKINELIDSTETAMQRYLTNEIDLDTCVRDAQSEIDRLLS